MYVEDRKSILNKIYLLWYFTKGWEKNQFLCKVWKHTTNYEKFLKRWEYQATWSASWEIRMHVRKQQLEMDMQWQTGSKLRKEYVKAVYCHPAYLTSMQSTPWEMLDWIKYKLESRLLGEI